MYKYYRDYYWKQGKPKGIDVLTEEKISTCESYKIVVDPYFKRYTIEKYSKGIFSDICYDSALFDFRRLKPVDQNAWQKETVNESDNEIICLIRNQDDRVIVKERYIFENGLCRSCETIYPSGYLISTQRIYYKKLGDESNKVVLYDRLEHPILIKVYDADETTGEFSELLNEQWDMSPQAKESNTNPHK
ncbi:MAG: hypothetical protein VX777_06210 [Chlamydiota bacterium]|nr:hypothetical protein [Chlamydiota bacterium]